MEKKTKDGLIHLIQSNFLLKKLTFFLKWYNIFPPKEKTTGVKAKVRDPGNGSAGSGASPTTQVISPEP